MKGKNGRHKLILDLFPMLQWGRICFNSWEDQIKEYWLDKFLSNTQTIFFLSFFMSENAYPGMRSYALAGQWAFQYTGDNWSKKEMSVQTPYLTLLMPFGETLVWATQQLEDYGFLVEQTFDLQVARQSHVGCPCPHHGNDQCSCQMVVLLVRYQGGSPTTMILHGNNEQTNFTLVKQIGDRSNRDLETHLPKSFV